MKLRILLADDNGIIRRLLRDFLEKEPGCLVCGEAENGQVAVEKVTELRPHVVILDFSMPVMNGLDAARRISRIAPEAVLYLFTMHNSEALQREARTAGIQQVISKTDRFQEQFAHSLRTLSASI